MHSTQSSHKSLKEEQADCPSTDNAQIGQIHRFWNLERGMGPEFKFGLPSENCRELDCRGVKEKSYSTDFDGPEILYQ